MDRWNQGVARKSIVVTGVGLDMRAGNAMIAPVVVMAEAGKSGVASATPGVESLVLRRIGTSASRAREATVALVAPVRVARQAAAR
jgi:hypothetical protein